MIHKHDIKTWFGSNEQFKTYFETEFKTNKLNGLKFPAWYARQFDMNNSDATVAEANVVKAAASLGNTYINAIVRAKKILGNVDFNWLLPAHREALKETVCGAIQHAILNKNVFERINSSTISVGTFTVNNDSTSWLISNDMLGQEAWNSLQLADLDRYEIVGDGFIGRVAYEDAQGQIVLYQWNNHELGKELSAPSHMGIEYSSFSNVVSGVNALINTGTKVDKYDYVYMTLNGERTLLRFEGGNWTNYDNWDRKDIKDIHGDRYLVYKNYILVGTSGGGIVPGSPSNPTGGGSVDLTNYLTRTEANIAYALKNDVYLKTETYSKSEIDSRVGGVPWLTDKYADITEFGNLAADYEVVRYSLNANGSNNSQGFTFIIKTPGGLKEMKTWQEIEDYISSTNFSIQKRIRDFTFTSTVSGGPVSIQEHFGDLDDQAQRTNFMDNVKIGSWYTFSIGGIPYQAAITSGDKTTNFQWTGFRIIDGANGKTPQIVNGSTSSTGHAETTGAITGDAYSSSINLPSGYAPTQYMPTDAIVQLIDNKIALVSDEQDRSWLTPDGTQTLTFAANKITIEWANSGIVAGDDLQLLLGSNAGNLVLGASINVYATEVEAKKNIYVSGNYSWYMFQSGTTTTFVMQDSASGLTNQAQNIAKYRYATPNIKPFDAHYTSQAEVLKNTKDIKAITKGTSLTVDLPAGLTTDNLTQLGLSVSGTTDWFNVEGWNKTEAFYINVTTEDAGNFWWIEYKVEAVAGDKTKLKLTNMESGNNGTDNATYVAHWIQFKGGR